MNDCVELRLIAGYSFKNADVWFNIVLPLAQFSCSCTSTHGLLSVQVVGVVLLSCSCVFLSVDSYHPFLTPHNNLLRTVWRSILVLYGLNYATSTANSNPPDVVHHNATVKTSVAACVRGCKSTDRSG